MIAPPRLMVDPVSKAAVRALEELGRRGAWCELGGETGLRLMMPTPADLDDLIPVLREHRDEILHILQAEERERLRAELVDLAERLHHFETTPRDNGRGGPAL